MFVQLTDEDARTILEIGRTGHLACIVDDEPYVVPINYAVDGEFVYMHSLPGRKLEGIRANPRVCLQVEEIHSQYNWRSVHVFGDCEEVTDPAEAERVFAALFARFPRLTPADSVRRYGHTQEPTVALRVRIRRLVGVGEGE